jgi:D-3-phosphoglycerate dehydrogenase
MAAPLKVLITDHTWPSVDVEQRILAEVGAEVLDAPSGEEEVLVGLARDAVGIMTCFAKTTGKVIEAAPGLRIVARYGVGVDNIDVATATRRGIPVTNVPDFCVEELSDHALALILAAIRKIARYDRATRGGRWDLTVGQPIHRVRGQTLGVVGLGRSGTRLAEKAAALGFRVVAHDRSATPDEAAACGARLVPLTDLLAGADAVSLHVPLTPETRHLIGAAELARMRPGAVLVNTARGGIVDLDALREALAAGRIGGAGLDVLPEEPPDPNDRLLRMENVILTPHVAFYSEESLVELQTKTAEEVARRLRGEPLRSVVNPEVLPRR